MKLLCSLWKMCLKMSPGRRPFEWCVVLQYDQKHKERPAQAVCSVKRRKNLKMKEKLWVTAKRILPPNFPTDLAEAFDGAKRAFWKAAAPAALAKEKIVRIYMERELQELNDRIEELENIDPDTELAITRDTNLQFRRRLDWMQHQLGVLEEENAALRAKLAELQA